MDTPRPAPDGLDPLLSIDELASYLRVPKQTIYDWRVDGKGPRAYRIGNKLRYTVADIRAWVEQQRDPASTPPPSPSATWRG